MKWRAASALTLVVAVAAAAAGGGEAPAASPYKKRRRLDHDTVAIALVFESDASNPTPHCGFDISFHVLHHDSVYCDADWPCIDTYECSDENVCVEPKSKSNTSRRLRRHQNKILLVLGIVVGALLLLALVISLCVFAAKKKKLEMQRAFVVDRDRVPPRRPSCLPTTPWTSRRRRRSRSSPRRASSGRRSSSWRSSASRPAPPR